MQSELSQSLRDGEIIDSKSLLLRFATLILQQVTSVPFNSKTLFCNIFNFLLLLGCDSFLRENEDQKLSQCRSDSSRAAASSPTGVENECTSN